MEAKRVLIITRDFVPYSFTLGGAIRVLKMAEFFAKEGLEVYVLAARGEVIDYFGYEENLQSFQTVYLPDKLQLFLTRLYNRKAKQKQLVKKFVTISYFFKKIVEEFFIPDRGIFFVNNFVREARRLIQEKKIKNVIVSSPPHSTQVVGLKLKQIFGKEINLVVDYRDSWNTTGIFAKKNPLSRFLSERLEKRVLTVADYFIYHSPRDLEKINKKFFDISSKSLLVTNGYDASLKNKIVPKSVDNKILTVGHFGSIRDSANSFRNPARFFSALLKFRQQIKLVFYGSADISEYWRKVFKDRLEIYEAVPHLVALQEMQKMDLLLVLHSQKEGADEVIPAKFYEYLLAQRPILVIGPKEMEVARIVENECLGYCADIYDEKDMLQTLERIYNDWKNKTLICYNIENYQEYSRQFQYSKILGILK